MTQLAELMKLSHDQTVLYVEDDASLREEMFEILDDIFNVVISAVDGEDGLDKFKYYKKKMGNYPDIIITDIHMPKYNGIEMSKKFLAYNAEQLIIVISSHNKSHYLVDLINMGIEHYLVKPVCSKHLLETLQRAVKKVHYKNRNVLYRRT